ncbi:MAG: ParB N-terminal domain-containing protein [Methanotrichaceae archaeon]|jgi:ParB-like chromosome segregation protein Spo0J
MAEVAGAKIEIDQEFAALIPKLSNEELAGLEESILKDGCIDPLRVWDHDGKQILLDGHNRYEICQKLGIQADTSTVEVADRNAAKIWIVKNQFGRRNLTDFDRSELVLKLKSLIAEQAKAKQIEGGVAKVQQKSSEPMETREELAKLADVSHDTIGKTETILESGSESLKAAARKKAISINSAAAIATLSKEEQDRVLEKGKKEVIKVAKEIKAEKKSAGYVDVETIEDLKADKRYASIQEMLGKCGLKSDLTKPWTVKRNSRKHEILLGWAGDDRGSPLILVVVDYPMAVFQVPDNDPVKWSDWRTRLYWPPEGGSEGQPKTSESTTASPIEASKKLKG